MIRPNFRMADSAEICANCEHSSQEGAPRYMHRCEEYSILVNVWTVCDAFRKEKEKMNKEPWIYLDYWPSMPCKRCNNTMEKSIYPTKDKVVLYYTCSQDCGGSAHLVFYIE